MSWLRALLGLTDYPSTGLAQEIAEAGVRNKQAFEKLQRAVASDPVIISVRRAVAEL